MNVTISPGGFEHFFPTIQARGLAAHNVEALTAVCDEFGIKVSGPPLSDEEIERIIALSDAGASGQRAAGEIE
jgi:hypothetical protein